MSSDSVINFYRLNDQWGEFSNFARYPIFLRDKKWPTTEHYFQAKKFEGLPYEEQIRNAPSAGQSAKLGRSRAYPLRKDWEEVKEAIMEEALIAKFTQHASLRELLLSTGDATLVEHTSNDSYWGDGGDGSGLNRLGFLLMKIRTAIRESPESFVDSSASSSTATSSSSSSSSSSTTTSSASTRIEQPYELYAVLDFEATCDDKVRLSTQEIIEFPTVLVNAQTGEIEATFQQYVKPVYNPRLSEFCTNLTGIEQSTVDAANTFPVVFAAYVQWLTDVVNGRSFIFVTCGDWDLKTMLPAQLQTSQLRADSRFSRWINIKKLFNSFYDVFPSGMTGMLEPLNIPLTGRHHSGIDDCRNISSVLIRMINDGCPIQFPLPKEYIKAGRSKIQHKRRR